MACDWPEDVALLKSKLPELARMEDYQVEDLYAVYSNLEWAAVWMRIGGYQIIDFSDWIEYLHGYNYSKRKA